MIAKLIQKLKSYSLFDYFLFLVIVANLIAAYGAFRAGDTSKGLDKLTIAILFLNMLVLGKLQDQTKTLIGDYQTLSDLKTEIIHSHEEEIESLRQENAKLQKANEKFKSGLFIK
jgi:hypothetical protein